MGIEIFGLIDGLLIVLAFLCRAQVAAGIMICLTMFVATNAVSVGGLTINPAVLFVPFYGVIAFTKKKPAADLAAPAISSGGLMLLLFMVYSLLITLLIPMLFNGDIQVVWPSGEKSVSRFTLLHPGIGNITQLGYAFVAVVCYFVTYHLFSATHAARTIVSLILAAASLNIFFAFLDNFTYYTGTRVLMSFVRNGNYSMLDGDTVAGIKRTVGTFTEASFFGGYTLALFASLLALYTHNIRRKMVGFILLGTTFFLIVSLSSTAYVGLTLYILRFLIPSLARLVTRGRISKASMYGLLLVIIIAATIVVSYMVFGGIAILDDLIINKAQSDSAMERTFLNANAWSNFLDSYGLGVGIGSTRAASFVLVLLSNTGVIGLVLYILFLAKSFKVPPDCLPEYTGVIIACREGSIAAFIAAALSVPVFDMGLLIYILAGAASALSATSLRIKKLNALERTASATAT